jgi:thiamine-phosphate pyrophosphorylase
VYGSRSKALAVDPRGVEGVRAVAAGLPAPVVAIGGISRETIGEVAQAGAACAAVIEACFGRDGAGADATANAAALVRAFAAGRAGRRP